MLDAEGARRRSVESTPSRRTKQTTFRVIVSASMNVSARAANSRIKTSIILIVVIASLCFSVGEGLRLTPFPIASLTGVGATDTPLTTKSADHFSSHKYGPLDVPTQHQKRNKRHAVPLDFLPTANSCAIPIALYSSATREPSDIVSALVVSQSAGRAPPFVS